MATLVNDLQFTLSNPCPKAAFPLLRRECRDQDYRSWRKIAVAVRASLLQVNYNKASTALTKKILSYLRSWLDLQSGIRDYPVAYALAMHATMQRPDPNLVFNKRILGFASPLSSNSGKFPEDPPIAWNITTIYNYTAITDELLAYIEEGWELVQQAEDEGALEEGKKHGELIRGEDRPPPTNWLPVVVAGVGIFGFIGLVLYGVIRFAPVYARTKKALK